MTPKSRLPALSPLLLLLSVTLTNGHSLAKRALVTPSTLPGTWTYSGCYTEASNGRALSGGGYTDGKAMTDEACVSYCIGKGFNFAGIEYASECYCGNLLQTGSVKAASEGDCSMGCSGNSTEACGGPNRLTVFGNGATAPAGPTTNPGPAGWASLGCYSEGTNGRALANGVATTGGGGALTVALCTTACGNGNYKYAGAEYAGECYCGNAISNGGAPATSGCSKTCNGNSSEYCGGANRLNIYQLGTSAMVSSAPVDVPTKTTALGAASTTAAPVTAAALPAGWSYKGCWVDNANGRIMTNQQPDSQQNTVESCSTTCQQLGYVIAGMEYGSQCFCGNEVIQAGALAQADTECSTPCSGNTAEKCGAGNRLSLYSNGPIQVQPLAVPQKSDLPGSWTYQGCYSEGTTGRTFKYQLILPKTNDAQTCLSQCSNFGFPAGGMEYGQECYCGDLADAAAAGSTLKPETDCATACPGDVRYVCGGGNRFSYYTWTGTPLAQFTVASGNAAGQYKFLVGGLVVPLITTAGVNGKVTFVEKFGTGPPNSTGAYELDLSLVDSGQNPWRAMHVKTDVFCSAGLILPDKAGREINVGGWSLQSTFGVRLYIPDGSPGVPGKNDWQENYQEVSLQNGRWYPSAMVMANGSILVVGGENGSNGPPVPTLEILPKPAGASVYFADWLNETDPYNLYPFTAVLPSGGIFAAYYNQARVLDAGSLGTTKMLPKIPGSVNNPASGRTYPFEGTQVLMPQTAPYSDPLTVMLCGGSNPGPAIAVDNCVSIQPDAANPQWVLERMPSQRVMTCIAPLPDGTYLIMNGAKQGTAGFGLATNPNLNAVLYDPTKALGSRFTIMANTTVARLYHSEAILLQDGRVLVSGSDPEDGKNPQEYRVEQFLPPYLLSGLTKPTFTIQNKDWAYGQQITFSATLAQGSTANLRVSLLGGVSSTHGNSMGARTIFPAVSCNGNTCTVTAPPNANVCPPGWFQMFILDGPTPSNSYWVRIGGDPARLGDWPTFADFSKPGV